MQAEPANLLAPPTYGVVLWWGVWLAVVLLIIRWRVRRRRAEVALRAAATLPAQVARLEDHVACVANQLTDLAEGARFTTAVLAARPGHETPPSASLPAPRTDA